MGNSSPLNIVLVSVLITLGSIKIKDQCYYCFLGLILIGLIFFIFGMYKFWKQKNG